MTDINDMAYTVGRAAALIESYAKKHFGPGTLTKLITLPRYHIGVFVKFVPADAWDEFAKVDFPASLIPVQQGIAWIGYDHAKKELAEQNSESNLRLFVGAQLHALRIKRGLSTRQLAELTGLTHSHIVRIEAGRYNVGIDTLEKLFTKLGAKLTIQV